MRRIPTYFFLIVFTLFAREAVCLDTASVIGKCAPPFELPDINGKKVNLADYQGKVVLVHFWATYCGPCKKEMPSLHNLYLALKKDGFIVLAVSKDENVKPVRSYVKKQDLSFPVVVDKDDEVSFVQYGVSNLPVSFLIDRNGIIREKIIGEQVDGWDTRDMKDTIGRLLSKNKKEGK